MESWIEVDDDALVLDAVNGVLERRKYFREKKRSYRQKGQHELDSLRTQLAQLQLHVKQLAQLQTQRRNKDARRNDSAVSWRTVAMHTKQQSHLVTVEHDELSQRVAASRKLVGAMQQWVLLAESIPISPKVIVRWQHVSLSEQPNSRKFGMEWATQQMYHNTDLPSALADEWVSFSESAQYVWPAPLEVARFMLRHHLKDIAVGFNTVNLEAAEWTENTVLYRLKLPLAPGDDASTAVSTLQAHFHEADRMDLRRLDSCRTSARMMTFGTLHVLQSGEGSLDELAELVGVDPSGMNIADKVKELRRVQAESACERAKEFQARVNGMLAYLGKQFLLEKV
ncbi:hypothetical protein Ae201684P_011818 [Aphanomyces euteiches]|nr:hypothetical protein Ae201684P_011818 [Aphanomyces euteiches]